MPSHSELLAEIDTLRAENARLRALLGFDGRAAEIVAAGWSPTLFTAEPHTAVADPAGVDRSSPRAAKVALFRTLFSGRDDVYALRWENQQSGKSGWGPAVRGGWGNARRPDREYLPFTDEVAERHLAGEVHAGLYPLLRGDTCRLLACDFDGPGWVLDSLAYLDAARSAGIPAVLERSRSGDGGHVWVFFSGPVPATSARRIGVHLLREAMTVRAELDLASYDRLFPTQDFMPKGSFGNLIALPLQGACRKRGTTVFLDRSTLDPHDDQWAFLARIELVTPEAADAFASAFGELATGPDASTYRQPRTAAGMPKPPEEIVARAGAMLGIDRIGVPPALLAALKHAASLHNPEFYEKERMRFSTWDTPRFIRCYRETLDQLLLPRGLRDKAQAIVAEAGSRLHVVDASAAPHPIEVLLRAVLTPGQAAAVDALAAHDLGMLVAEPGSGKTVVGCALVARHATPTLVIVDRKPLVEQWRDRLVTHLGLSARQIGQIGGGRNRTTGVVDVAMVQSLARRDDIAELTGAYGLVIVDECHHVPAVTFERAVREIPVRRWVGLTATPYRRDGLQALMAMHCGPVRHRMAPRSGSALRALDLIVHETDHQPAEEGQPIQTIYRGLVEDTQRTHAICDDIAIAVTAGRNCLVLTRWTEHLDVIVEMLAARDVEALVLHGKLGKKARTAVTQRLAEPRPKGGMLLAATAGLIGEGFDCPPLDTLFLAFPIKFKGNVVQYVGRVLRPTDTKTRVEVHDYVDALVPVLARQHHERCAAYATLGFDVPRTGTRRTRTPRTRPDTPTPGGPPLA
ncbi:MAG: TOTE conflict system archaeo-eukaryotic primase domain-containing protein [Acidimicrobiia bacterium]